MKAFHVTYEEKSQGEREVVLYTSDGEQVQRIAGAAVPKLIEAWQPGPVRFSHVKAADAILLAIHERGAVIMHAHWHATGIAKSSTPEQIAQALAQLPDSKFRVFTPDAKIAALRNAVGMRDALIRYHGDATRRLLQVARNQGAASRKDITDPNLLEAFADLDEAPKSFRSIEEGKAISWETRISHIAKTIPECLTFARVAHVESLGSAAALVSAINGVERFESVAGLWKYCGQHVNNGKSAKRAKGIVSDWSPKAKVVMYLLGVAIQKHNANPWNAIYRQFKEQELNLHAEKCPNCKSPLGHCDARARRRMVKEILKRFYLEVKGERFLDQRGTETHVPTVEEPQTRVPMKPSALPSAAKIHIPDHALPETHTRVVRKRPQTTALVKTKRRTSAAKLKKIPDQEDAATQRNPVRKGRAIQQLEPNKSSRAPQLLEEQYGD